VRVRLSKKNQISFPTETSLGPGIEPGDCILVDMPGDSLVLIPEPTSHTEALRVLGTEYLAEIEMDESLRRGCVSWER
jgi:bifunctional DNA-binding transcriptional regulator/antitoxin component of YhaV-PrlF toxin-antitoxin module